MQHGRRALVITMSNIDCPPTHTFVEKEHIPLLVTLTLKVSVHNNTLCAYLAHKIYLNSTPIFFFVESRGGSQLKETFGGYDCEFAQPPQSALQTECPICIRILRDPHQCKRCRLNFCYSCSKQVQTEHKTCPVCRDSNFEVFEDKALKQALSQLHVLCSEGGCKWKGELGELERHLSEVIHPGESFIIQRELVVSHISDIIEKCYNGGKRYLDTRKM